MYCHVETELTLFRQRHEEMMAKAAHNRLVRLALAGRAPRPPFLAVCGGVVGGALVRAGGALQRRSGEASAGGSLRPVG